MSSEIVTIPFTYRIGWSKLDKHYYGVKYAKGATPKDLWTTYFTSSKIVDDYRNIYGEPDIIEIRKVFTDSKDALLWEKNVLIKLGVINNEKWLNQSYTNIWELTPDEKSKVISGYMKRHHKNMSVSDRMELSIKQSIGRKNYIMNRTPEQVESDKQARMVAASKSGEKISIAAKKRYECDEYRQAQKDAHNTPEYINAAKERTILLFENDAYREKHLKSVQSDEYRKKQSDISNDIWSDETLRKKQSDILKERCNDPEYRKLMSQRATASTGNRLATRSLNKLSIEYITNTSISDIIIRVKKDTGYNFDESKLIKKIKKKLL